MVVVKKKKGESDDKLINRFKQQVIKHGVILELRDRGRHTPKSEKRKEQKSRKKHSIELQKKRNY